MNKNMTEKITENTTNYRDNTVDARVEGRVIDLYKKIKGRRGDDLAAALVVESERLQVEYLSQQWELALLTYLAYEYWETMSMELRRDYVSVDGLMMNLAGDHIKSVRGLPDVFKLILENESSLPREFKILRCRFNKVKAALKSISSGMMTDMNWLLLRDPSVPIGQFKKALASGVKARKEVGAVKASYKKEDEAESLGDLPRDID